MYELLPSIERESISHGLVSSLLVTIHPLTHQKPRHSLPFPLNLLHTPACITTQARKPDLTEIRPRLAPEIGYFW
jgi:hypothetical protein